MRRTFPIVLILAIGLAVCIAALAYVPYRASLVYGPPAPSLSSWQLFSYSARLLWYDGLLTEPSGQSGVDVQFQVQSGETVQSVAGRLREAGLIRDADAFRSYLIYTGTDTTIQAGDYALNPHMSIVDIARQMQDATPSQVSFVVLPGWRMEEVAASLPTSGLSVTPEQFLAAAQTPPPGIDYLNGATTTEGFLYPDSYLLPRDLSAERLVSELVHGFSLRLTNELRTGFARQNLTIYQAVTLASLVQREAVEPDEQPIIASVFLNRLAAGMKLDSDPTVQYALGYNTGQETWWTNPLSASDLKIDSPYNTYLYAGLPPAPIANPGLSALQAVAYPAETPYYYFQALCDGSGRHAFSETFEQHLQNICP